MRPPQAVTIQTAPWKPEGWIAAKDFFTALRLTGCLFASVLPARLWPAASRLMARAHVRARPRSTRLLDGAEAFANHDRASIVERAIAADYLANVEAIRELLPGGWRGEINLIGREVLDRALARSRGAVVWFSPFAGSDVVVKKALAAAGYPLTHLSSPSHPFSSTRFGVRILNPIRLRAVDRYLAQRVLVVYGNARPALDALERVLRDNGVVSVTATGAGARSAVFPFLGGTLELAMGAPLLAFRSGAALVPAFTLPDGRGGYRVELGPDLTPTTASTRHEAIRHMGSRFVELLEPIVAANPAQWECWFHPGTWSSRAPASAPASATSAT
jgi:lauroyl/myristoyl acyltransferase